MKNDNHYYLFYYLIIFFRLISFIFATIFIGIIELKIIKSEHVFLAVLFALSYIILLSLYSGIKQKFINKHYMAREDVSNLMDAQEKFLKKEK